MGMKKRGHVKKQDTACSIGSGGGSVAFRRNSLPTGMVA